MKKIIFVCTIFIFYFLAAGCTSTKLTADINVARNLNNPIIVDFVFVFEQPVVEELKKIPSLQWFSKKSQYKSDLELSGKIQVLTYEVVPGQKLSFKNFRPDSRALGLVVYGSYLSQGEHRVVLSDYSKVSVNLQKDNFTVKMVEWYIQDNFLEKRLRQELLAIDLQNELKLSDGMISVFDIYLAPISLAYDIIKHGKVLVCKDKLKLYEVRKKIMSRFELDLDYHRKIYGSWLC